MKFSWYNLVFILLSILILHDGLTGEFINPTLFDKFKWITFIIFVIIYIINIIMRFKNENKKNKNR